MAKLPYNGKLLPAKGKVDEFDESEWIRQSLTNQYSQISAFIMLSNREMSSNSSNFPFVKVSRCTV